MASTQPEAEMGDMEVQRPSSDTLKDVEAVTIELPAPQGWSKKFIPKKGGTGTPRRNEIVFIAPTGEEIKNKRQLDQYLKTHPDGPSSSQFDWGTGDTPRRSARLSSNPKATDTPESGSSRKRQKKSLPKKEETDGVVKSTDDGTAANRTEDEKDVEMKDAEAGDYSEEEKPKEGSEAVQQKEGDGVGLPDGNQAQPGENKMKVVTEQEISQVPEESKKKEQPEENETETALVTLPSQGEELHDKNKPEAAENPSDAELPGDIINGTEEKQVDNKEQPGENKSEAIEKTLDVELPGNTNSATEEEPMENKKEHGENPAEVSVLPEIDVSLVNTAIGSNKSSSANVGKEIEVSKQNLETPEKKVSLEEVGSDSNTANEKPEGAILHENQPVKSDGAPQEPDASKPISC